MTLTQTALLILWPLAASAFAIWLTFEILDFIEGLTDEDTQA